MNSFIVSDYMENYNKVNKSGICRSCSVKVQWNRERVASHKRGKCLNVTAAEKNFFMKRKSESCLTQDISISEESSDIPEPTFEEIDRALANYYLRTGTSTRIADSRAWKNLICLLNPAYAKRMPSAKVISGNTSTNSLNHDI
jgi:hypothetical protein